MDYSNLQFLFTLVLDGFLGIVCGWSLRRWLHLESVSGAEVALRKDLALLEYQLRVAREDFVREQTSASQSCVLLTEARASLQLTAARLKDSEEDSARLKKAVADAEAALAARCRELVDARISISELETAIVEKARRNAALEIRVAELEPLVPKRLPRAANGLEFPQPTAEPRDDLKEIVGIGRVCEKKLNEAGVRLFSQIAAWTKEDVERFKALLPKWGDRILRDKWVESARKLHEEKYGPVVMRVAC